ncbi:SAF domain-containing protein [Nesterenkonia marinintestina]|uniref:SAF domain-containing protein n=1 Tax=Nesterenkonia marinintestina TaxID=2979865 RepID=UPI0021C22956|nr:flagellar biosynthesis protein FlgA [Nesterenkonia sp. GX14115]
MSAYRDTGDLHSGKHTGRRPGGGEAGHDEEPAVAERLRRPGWRDPRLLAGIMIVLVSVAGVVALVASQDRTTSVYAAAEDLDVGSPVTADDLRVEQVRLDGAEDRYLTTEDDLDEGTQIVAAVEEGELLPQRVVDDSDPQGRQAVILEVDHTLATAVESGRAVDVWATYPSTSTSDSPARAEQLVDAAKVASVSEDSSAFGSQSRTSVEVLIDPEDMATVLEARGEAQIAVVPAGVDPETQL